MSIVASKFDKSKKKAKEEISIDKEYFALLNKKEGKKAGKKSAESAKTHSVRNTVLISVLSAVLLCGAVFAYIFFFSGVPFGRILNNVTVAGIDVGGLTKEEAEAVLSSLQNSDYDSKDMTVNICDDTLVITPEQAAIKLDVPAAVKLAYRVGRNGSLAARRAEREKASEGKLSADVSSCLSMNAEFIRTEIEKITKKYSKELTQSAFRIDGTRPELKDPLPKALPTGQTLTLTKGTAMYAMDTQDILANVLAAYGSDIFTVEASFEVTKPDPLDLNKIFEENCLKPVDAALNTETYEIIPHTYGYGFDLEDAKAKFASAGDGEEITIPFQVIDPKVKSSDISSTLFRDVLGSYTARASSQEGRDTNLRKSCEAINGIIIKPGEIFSYNPVLGERTKERGWKQADGYIGNKTVLEYGGGICQASSCLYLSAMIADLEIVERTNHGFISSYMPYGMDATVSWGGPEFRFKNTMSTPIMIEASASGGTVTVKLLGTDTRDYYVKMTYDILNVYPYSTVEQKFHEGDGSGYRDGQVLISPYTGYRIRTYRNKYSKATDELISSTVEATSYYSKRDKVVARLVQDAPPPTEATTAPTE